MLFIVRLTLIVCINFLPLQPPIDETVELQSQRTIPQPLLHKQVRTKTLHRETDALPFVPFYYIAQYLVELGC